MPGRGGEQMAKLPANSVHGPMRRYVVLGGTLFLLCAAVGWLTLSGERTLSAVDLAELALFSASENEREDAAIRLARHPDKPVGQLRRVFAESKSARVRAAAAMGLGRLRDWESGPLLIAALEDPSPLLRGRAAQALNRIAAEDFRFRARDPLKKRQQKLQRIKRKWPLLHRVWLAERSRREKRKP